MGFRGGVWGRDDMRPAWKRGTPQQGQFHMHTPLFGDFRVSGWGFGVGFRMKNLNPLGIRLISFLKIIFLEPDFRHVIESLVALCTTKLLDQTSQKDT